VARTPEDLVVAGSAVERVVAVRAQDCDAGRRQLDKAAVQPSLDGLAAARHGAAPFTSYSRPIF